MIEANLMEKSKAENQISKHSQLSSLDSMKTTRPWWLWVVGSSYSSAGWPEDGAVGPELRLQLLRRKLIMYIALQTDMTDISVSQAKAPGETINYCDEEYCHLVRRAVRKTAYPSDSVEPSPGPGGSPYLLHPCYSTQGWCCLQERQSQSVSQHCGLLQGEFVIRNRAAARLASQGLTGCRRTTGQK